MEKSSSENNCQYCDGQCVKNGLQHNGIQRLKCKVCKKTQQRVYNYGACRQVQRKLFWSCLVNGCSLRGTQRITGIAVSTQIRLIKAKGRKLVANQHYNKGDIYELDEMRTYVGRKKNPIWVIMAVSRTTRQIVDMQVGYRTKRTLKIVTDKLLLLEPRSVYTDGLKEYRYLMPSHIHRVKAYGTNHIERFNLTLRTHLARLTRRSICFSKSKIVLEGVVKCYLWG